MRIKPPLLAFLVSLACTLGLVAYGCQTGSRDACLIGQGAGVFMFAILFLFFWAVFGSFKAASSFLTGERPDSVASHAQPPVLLDGALVLAYAATDDGVEHTGRNASPAPRIAICENLAADDVFLMHCDADWNTMAAERFASLEDARQHAESSYAGVTSKWHSYRALSDEEKSRVEEARSYLRDMAAKVRE